MLESSRSTGKGGPDFQKELTGYDREPGVVQSCSQTKKIRNSVILVLWQERCERLFEKESVGDGV